MSRVLRRRQLLFASDPDNGYSALPLPAARLALRAGDLAAMLTNLQPGDVLELEIRSLDGSIDLGRQTNKIVGTSQQHCPFSVFVHACDVAGELAEPGQRSHAMDEELTREVGQMPLAR